MDYSLLKFIHFAGFISWMAMLFYQPRLYVYHAENLQNKNYVEVVKIQERKLFNGIGWPAMFVTIFSGVGLIIKNPELMKFGFFHLKLTCALILICYHFSLLYFLIKFRKDECNLSGKFFRFFNEIPTIAMLVLLYAMLVLRYS